MSRAFHQSDLGPRGRIIGHDPADIAAAAACLQAGDLVGMPTETVYGLAADATNGEAVAAIYEAKGRPAFNPLICHVADLAEAERHGLFNAEALRLAEAFWPGPLTIVAPFRPGSAVSDLARAGLDSIALRVPAHPVARALIAAAGRPLAAPSANLSGRISPTAAGDVARDLGERVACIIDAGVCDIGLESTIVSCLAHPVAMLRPGGVPRESLEALLGAALGSTTRDILPRSPGLLQSHYAPFAPVRINVTEFQPSDSILAFGNIKKPTFIDEASFVNLSPNSNLRQAASRLFTSLRVLDARQPAAIAVAPIPSTGLGEAINDRLVRAAAPRS
ncbi:MAG: threonylcarbamoyl-AMP synthase [Methylocystis sp.]|jgi:L-threonylcarbamoyladenylate synthase|nr:threonylcarbamoyl-AMP synthase [Methylocystis sp.]MCA3583630.1 threonylcarbamoyl-AMP synthase [Methylocystis sp.]MCA3593283.1 threonylcarbamoyl-AMP synthase [Methylocystis sp.]